MADVKWIKITTNIFDDEKIKLLETLPDSDMLIIIWFKLLTLAGRCNDCGMIYLTREVPYNEEMLSTIMRRPVNTVRLAMSEFQKLGMVEIVNNYISIVNWNKHQTLDKYEIVKQKNRERKQLSRENLKQIAFKTDVTGQSRDVTLETRLDKTRLDKIRQEKRKKDVPQEFIDLAKFMFSEIQSIVAPPCYCKRKPDLTKWAEDLSKLRYLDDRPVDEIRKVISWTVRDHFWRSNILSASKLREKYNTLYLQMTGDKNNKPEKPSIYPDCTNRGQQ